MQTLVKKLKFVRTYKEHELKQKQMKCQSKREMLLMEQNGQNIQGANKVQDEIDYYKEKY